MAETPEPQGASKEENADRLPPKKASVKLNPASKTTGNPIKLKPASPASNPSKPEPKDAEKLEVEKLTEEEDIASTGAPAPKKEGSILDEIMGAPAQDMDSVDDEWEEEYIEEPEDFDVSMSIDLDDLDDGDVEEASGTSPQDKPKIKPVIAGRANLPKISELTAKNRLQTKGSSEASDDPVSVEGETKGPEGAPKPTLTPKVPTGSPKTTLKPRTDSSPAAQKPTLAQQPTPAASAPPAQFAPQKDSGTETGSKIGMIIQGVSLAALILLVILLLKELLPLIGG